MGTLAAETRDWAAVRAFVAETTARECWAAPADAPAPLLRAGALPSLCLGLPQAPAPESPFRVFTTGGTDMEGAMILRPESDFAADLRATVVARSERALRLLLLAFPPGPTGLFAHSAPWALATLEEVFSGQALPPRAGRYTTLATFRPVRPRPTRPLGPADEGAVSPAVWRQAVTEGHTVFASEDGRGLGAICGHRAAGAGRREVCGLQVVRDGDRDHALSAFSAATEDVLARGLVPICGECQGGLPWAEVPERLGYLPFYRVGQYLGVKRGGGIHRPVDAPASFQGAGRDGGDPGRRTSGDRPAVDLGLIRALANAEGRSRTGLFAAEGTTLARRALDDGLPVACLVYTGQAERLPAGEAVLQAAWRAGIPHQRVSDGVMGTLTPTRPLPPVLAAVHARPGDARGLHLHTGSVVMVTERIQNPDNLGMVLRTADALGVDAVVVAGADPLHRQCVRAARGAVGRVPLRLCADLPGWLNDLRADGVRAFGATPRGEEVCYESGLQPPLALIVGNEQDGITEAVLGACTGRVRIPMAPGQDSLNVAVAAGMLLYEAMRQRISRAVP